MTDKDHFLDDALDKTRRECERFARKYVRRLKNTAEQQVRERRAQLVEAELPFDAEREADQALFTASDGVLGAEHPALPLLGGESLALSK